MTRTPQLFAVTSRAPDAAHALPLARVRIRRVLVAVHAAHREHDIVALLHAYLMLAQRAALARERPREQECRVLRRDVYAQAPAHQGLEQSELFGRGGCVCVE
jgi:hypothetical protein